MVEEDIAIGSNGGESNFYGYNQFFHTEYEFPYQTKFQSSFCLVMGILLHFSGSKIADARSLAENDATEKSAVELNCWRSG